MENLKALVKEAFISVSRDHKTYNADNCATF